MTDSLRRLLILALSAGALSACGAAPEAPTASPAPSGSAPEAAKPLRFATFNAALNREAAGQLRADLAGGAHPQGKAVAAIIQRVRPDVLLLQEFDRDLEALTIFQDLYLGRGQDGAAPIEYPYVYVPAVNTGTPSGLDLDKDGRADGPGDALGFGRFPGQYGFALLSTYPIDADHIRSHQRLLWRDMPGAHLPIQHRSEGGWYSEAALAALPLSSKNHVVVPIEIGDRRVHVVAAHPTPPVFDGPEDRNGHRNYDELALAAALISGADWPTSDQGQPGPALGPNDAFVLMGDMNADPTDGDSMAGAIAQILDHPRVHPAVARGPLVPRSAGSEASIAARPKSISPVKGDPGVHTAGWGLRVDYVLPSVDLTPVASGVFWPAPGAPDAALVQPVMVEKHQHNPSSDHRLVWVDLTL